MNTYEWTEAGQRFRYDGCVIRSQKPAKLRLAYGDERLRQIREERAAARPPLGPLKRLLARMRSRSAETSH